MQPVVDINQSAYQPNAYQQNINNFHQLKPLDKKKSKFKRLVEKLTSTKLIVVVIVLLQILALYLIVNPINLFSQLTAVQVVNRVAAKVSVPPADLPQLVARIGDGKNLPNAEELRKENEIQAQVYKDAQNGDYVISYPNKMIVYRESNDTIIYQGDTPRQILEKTQQDLLAKLIEKAKSQKIIEQNSQEIPQLSSVTDVNELKKQNANFYANTLNNDIIALFPTAGKVLIYRPSTGDIVNSGSFRLNIN